MVIQHYPQSGGGSKEDKAETRIQRHTIDREYSRERPVRGKKNRHRWCRGKVGVEHRTEWEPWRISHRRLVCVVCGRHLDYEFRSPPW